MTAKVDAQQQQHEIDKKSKKDGDILNDASVNASIRLCLKVMIIMRQEKHNKAAE
jgi:hypothetical protein